MPPLSKTKAKPKPSSKKSNFDLSAIEDKEVQKFLKFYKIELKSEEELQKLSKTKYRQYLSRLRRWESLVDTETLYQIHKALTMFANFDEAILEANREINEKSSDPEFQSKDDNKKKLAKDQNNLNEVVKHLRTTRKTFDELYEEFKIEREAEQKRIKEEAIEDMADDYAKKVVVSEAEDMDDSDVEYKEEIEVKEEYMSEESDKDIELKEEYISEQSDEDIDDKKAVRKAIKKEIKSEFDRKPNIKREIKSELKSEVKDEKVDIKVKQEYISSDDDE